MDVTIATPRYFGITPPTLLFGIATATLAIAVVLAMLGRWLAALALAAAVLVELALFLGVARRKPDSVVATASVRAMTRPRERAAWLVQATNVRTEAGRRLTPLRRELLEVGERRERQLRELGAAVYEGDEDAATLLTEELNRLDEERRRKEGEMRKIEEAALRRLERGRLRVQQTVIKRPEDRE
jgi:hypothetical protein